MKKYLLYVLAGVLLTACGKEETIGPNAPQTPGEGEIRFEIGIASPQGATDADPQTRVITDENFKCTWEPGDEIGIFAFEEGTNVTSKEYYIKNVKLTYDDEKWQSETPLYWPKNGKKLRFYACYPYNAMQDVADFDFKVKTDQDADTDGKSNLELSDLMMTYSIWLPSGSPVELWFSHNACMVELKLDNTAGSIDPNEKLTVKMRDVATKASFTFKSSGWKAMSGTDNADITMRRVERPGDADYRTSYTFRAIVPLQMQYEEKRLFRISNGSMLLNGSPMILDLKIGRAELFTQKLPAYIHKVPIPAGTFLMGSPDSDPDAEISEKPQKSETIPSDFYMGRYEVTRTQYAEFLNAVGVPKAGQNEYAKHTINDKELYLFQVDKWGWTPQWNDATGRWEAQEDYPMIYVTWHGAEAFADWAGGRLPTEIEWEYACRARTTTRWSFGDDNNLIGDYVVCYRPAAEQIGTRLPNPWGLYNMHGNVGEWTTDNWGSDVQVIRGGSYYDTYKSCRSAYKRMFLVDEAYYDVGFRLVFDKK